MTSEEYSEKLKDPRWQKKRLEILQRDEWTCRICTITSLPLNVHHWKYLPNRDPWDYPNELLITLCDDCHNREKDRHKTEELLLDALRLTFTHYELQVITEGFTDLANQSDGYCSFFQLEDAIAFAVSNPQMRKILLENYRMYLDLTYEKRTEEIRKGNPGEQSALQS